MSVEDDAATTAENDANESAADEPGDGYVHEPGGGYVHEQGAAADEPRESHGRVHPHEADREFGWRGWVLVGVIVLAFVVAPGLVLLRPPALPFEVAFLVLPLVPALLLGIVAVWATTRP